VLGADDQGESGLSYRWSTTGTPPAPVSFSANGTNAAKNTTATFTRAGTYGFSVLIQEASGLSTTSAVTVVVNQTLTSIVVSPSAATVATGGTQQFTAAGKDQFGILLATAPAFSWSVSGGGTIGTSGLFTAGTVAGGPFTVTASTGGKGGTAAVTVVAPTTTTLAPVADAYVRDGTYASANFGTATSLVVKVQSSTTGNHRITFLRFSFSGLSGGVTAAKLRLYGLRPSGNGVTDSAYAVSDNSWSETGITWNNLPAIGAVQGSGVAIGTVAQYYEWDVTAFVKAQRSAAASAVSLAVQMDASVTIGPDTFNSREAASNHPQLVITGP
jgi:hypothetical protein